MAYIKFQLKRCEIRHFLRRPHNSNRGNGVAKTPHPGSPSTTIATNELADLRAFYYVRDLSQMIR